MNNPRLQQELADHLERRTAELRGQGLDEAAARRRARAEFGSPESVRQELHEGRRLRWLRDGGQDTRFALRSWRRAPGFAATALAILALGIGANAVMFGLLQATLLRALPYPHDRQLVYLSEYDNHGADQTFSVPDMADYRKEMGDVFQSMGGYRDLNFTYDGGRSGAVLVPGRLMTAGMFETLGVRPLLGRWFSEAEHRPKGPAAVMLSYGLWQSRFGGRKDIVGQPFPTPAGHPTIVGVMPRDFQFGLAQIYAPYEEAVPAPYLNDRANSFILYGLGRTRPGVGMEQVRAAVATISARLAREYPASNATVHGEAMPYRAKITGAVGPSLWMVFAAVSVLLLIVCVNLANLLLARAAGRAEEMAVRAALGAGRSRLARQLLAEGLLLSLLGGGAGLLLAAWGLRATAAALPLGFPLVGGLGLNGTVVGYSLGLALATGVLFSLAPMLLALRTSLRARQGLGRHRLHSALIVAEVAMAMALLTAAGLMLRSMAALDHVDLGFQPDHLVTATVVLNATKYRAPGAAGRFFAELKEKAAALPGVAADGMVFPAPYTTQIANCFLAIPGHAPDPNAPLTAYYFNASAGYFETVRQPLLRGRYFTAADDAQGAPPVVIVDQSLAEQYFGSVGKAVGNRLQMFSQVFGQTGPNTIPPATIVGVVAEVKAERPDVAPHREIYTPLSQPNGFMTLVLRTAKDTDVTPAIRGIVRGMDPSLVAPRMATMAGLVAQAESTRILSLRLLAVFAAVALLLAGLGLYGVLAYLVHQRRRELGIRLALGAGRPALLRMIVRQGMGLALVGLGLGSAATVALARLMASLLFGVSPYDPLTLGAVGGVLLAAALLASYLPGRRAAGLDPLFVLRAE